MPSRLGCRKPGSRETGSFWACVGGVGGREEIWGPSGAYLRGLSFGVGRVGVVPIRQVFVLVRVLCASVGN